MIATKISKKQSKMAKYKLFYHKSFVKDYKKLGINDRQLVDSIIIRLADGETLESKYHNHTLKGNLKGFSECHIKPNLLLVYAKYDETLELDMLRVGSHSKILGT